MASLLIAVIYLCFISLGLPDSLLGAAWPQMHITFDVPSAYAGYVAMTISFMTIVSALLSPYLIKRISTKWIVNGSTLLTVIGLIGFSLSSEYRMLFIFAVPYGLGAGSIDAAINNYVALHYKSSVMNFLHCFYGLGAVAGPLIMSAALKYARWNEGYRWTAYVQIAILVICLASTPLWKLNKKEENEEKRDVAGIRETIKIPGVIPTLLGFFAYCAGEATCFLWTSSYFAGTKTGMSEELVAAFGSLVFGGLMLGRLISGFVSNKLGDRKMIRIGIALEFAGIILVALPDRGYILSAVGFVLIGCGMGPVYPAIQHMAPVNFGKRYSPAVIGMQMASAYIGSTFIPAVFGQLQEVLGIRIMPAYVALFAFLNALFLGTAYRRIGKNRNIKHKGE